MSTQSRSTLLACVLMLVTMLGITQIDSLRSLAVRGALSSIGFLPPHDGAGRTNVLVLGVGDSWHSGGDLTDTILIASIDASTQSIVFLSLPRDIELASKEGSALGRINTVYARQKYALMHRAKFSETGASLLALEATAAQFSTLTSTEIHGVVLVNFSGFIDIIDAVGGIDVDVPNALTDYQFPLTEKNIGSIRIKEGVQHMSGRTALWYARSRSTTSDFDRTDRQQLILSALSSRMKSPIVLGNPRVYAGLLRAMRSNVKTTFSPSELVGLAATASSIAQKRVMRMHLHFNVGSDTTEAMAGGFVYPGSHFASGAILLPVSLENDPSDWSQIQSFASMLFEHREAHLERMRITLEPLGTKKIEVYRLKNELLRYGFDVVVKKSDSAQSTVSQIITKSSSKTASLLSELLGISVHESNSTKMTNQELRLLLDKKFTYVPFAILRK